MEVMRQDPSSPKKQSMERLDMLIYSPCEPATMNSPSFDRSVIWVVKYAVRSFPAVH